MKTKTLKGFANAKETNSEVIGELLITEYDNGILTVRPRGGLASLIAVTVLLSFLGLPMFLIGILMILTNTSIIWGLIVSAFGAFLIWTLIYTWNKYMVVFDVNNRLMGFRNVIGKTSLRSGLGEVLGFSISPVRVNERTSYFVYAICEKSNRSILNTMNPESAEEIVNRLCRFLSISAEIDEQLKERATGDWMTKAMTITFYITLLMSFFVLILKML